MNKTMSVCEFIQENWDKCKRYEPNDNGTLIGMPYPYITPTVSNIFQEMYYWDTYFACEGLVLTGKTDLAKNCADNMSYMIDKYGIMPNGSRTYYLNHSQPPYFCMLVNLIYEHTKDDVWLKEMYEIIEKEYTFWQTNRISPNGLNCYGSGKYDEQRGKELYDLMSKRFHIENRFNEYNGYADIAENIIAECESGWDFNPRFNYRCKDYNPIDLNSNLYVYETLMAKFSNILNYEDVWTKRVNKRKELINKYLWNGEYFCDYNYVKDFKSGIFSAAVLSIFISRELVKMNYCTILIFYTNDYITDCISATYNNISCFTIYKCGIFICYYKIIRFLLTATSILRKNIYSFNSPVIRFTFFKII